MAALHINEKVCARNCKKIQSLSCRASSLSWVQERDHRKGRQMNASSQKLSQVGVRVREQQEKGWREFGDPASSPDVAVVSVCICNSIFQAPL